MLSIDFRTASEAIRTHAKPSILCAKRWFGMTLFVRACVWWCVCVIAAPFLSPSKKRYHCSKNYANHHGVCAQLYTYVFGKISVFNNVRFSITLPRLRLTSLALSFLLFFLLFLLARYFVCICFNTHMCCKSVLALPMTTSNVIRIMLGFLTVDYFPFSSAWFQKFVNKRVFTHTKHILCLSLSRSFSFHGDG